MKRKGFTLIELLVVMVVLMMIGVIVTGVIVGCTMIVKHVGSNKPKEVLLVENPPAYENGQVVEHILTSKKLIVVDNSFNWDKTNSCWKIKVKDGGNMDIVGGFAVLETEVKTVTEIKKME